MPSHQIMVLLWEMESTSTGQGAREAGMEGRGGVGIMASSSSIFQCHFPVISWMVYNSIRFQH